MLEYILLFFNVPVFVVNELYIPDGATVFDERRGHVTNLGDSMLYCLLHTDRSVDASEEVTETLVGSCPRGTSVPDVANRTDIILEVNYGVVAVG